MKIPRVLLLVAISCLTVSILFTASGTSTTSKQAHADSCSVYQVGSPAYAQDPNASFTVFLMYSTCASSNFAIALISPTGGNAIEAVAIVERQSGPDGDARSLENYCAYLVHGYCGSPKLYAPNNPAHACVYDNSFLGMPEACTDWY